jgi:Ser/Thr protein kinase RdoA (MazF antagonist)
LRLFPDHILLPLVISDGSKPKARASCLAPKRPAERHDLPIHTPDRDRWTPQAAAQLAERACRAADLTQRDLRLVRFGTNAVFEVEGTSVALRLRRPGTAPEEIQRQIDLANWLAERAYPVNRPIAELSLQDLDGAVASFWEWIDEDRERQVHLPDLARLLRTLHGLLDEYPAAADFPRWDPFDEIEQRLRALELEAGGWPDQAQLDLFRDWSLRNRDELGAVDWALPGGLIHGDAHVGNVLTAGNGTDVIIDLDAVAQGCREWDLVPTAVSQLRFRATPDSLESFTAAYGFDLLQWSGWPAMKRTRELYMTSWLMSVANNDRRREEANHRMRCLTESDEQVTWHAV